MQEVKRARGDVPDILPELEPEPELTSQASDFENSYNYICKSLYAHLKNFSDHMIV